MIPRLYGVPKQWSFPPLGNKLIIFSQKYFLVQYVFSEGSQLVGEYITGNYIWQNLHSGGMEPTIVFILFWHNMNLYKISVIYNLPNP